MKIPFASFAVAAILCVLLGLFSPSIAVTSADVAASCYPPAEKRTQSPGHTTYYVHPTKGKDTNSGLKPDEPWRSFVPVNARRLAPGDRVEILAGGTFQETLMPLGAGSSEEPIEIRFATGEYDFFPAKALKLKLHISNTNDDPYTPKPIAWLFRTVQHCRVSGNNADIYIHGKMIELVLDHAEDVVFSGLAFDYRRPLVSEFTVVEVASDHADVQVHCDSTYTIEKEKLVWVGEGWHRRAWG